MLVHHRGPPSVHREARLEPKIRRFAPTKDGFQHQPRLFLECALPSTSNAEARASMSRRATGPKEHPASSYRRGSPRPTWPWRLETQQWYCDKSTMLAGRFQEFRGVQRLYRGLAPRSPSSPPGMDSASGSLFVLRPSPRESRNGLGRALTDHSPDTKALSERRFSRLKPCSKRPHNFGKGACSQHKIMAFRRGGR
jgi:hypothetical protein